MKSGIPTELVDLVLRLDDAQLDELLRKAKEIKRGEKKCAESVPENRRKPVTL